MRKTYDLDGLPHQLESLANDFTPTRYVEVARAVEPTHQPSVSLQNTPTLLVEANTLLREGLKRILAETAYAPASSSATLEEACVALDMSPGAVLMIIGSAGDHGELCERIRDLKETWPASRVVFLVDDYDLKQIFTAFQSGVDAYLIKSVSCEVLVKSLDLVMLGESVFPAAILELLQNQGRRIGTNGDGSGLRDESEPESLQSKGLSVRETVILRCLMDGDSNKVIARKFDITEATVKVHVKAILRKIQAKNRTQAAIWAANYLPADEHAPTS
jgi:two-component system nitrate/nitrite response regulator NarL